MAKRLYFCLFFNFLLLTYIVDADLDLTETSQEPLLVLPGDDAMIDCTVHELGNHTVIWRYANGIDDLEIARTLTADKVRVTDDPRFSVLHRTGHEMWVLKIREAMPSDSGVYMCQVNTDPPLSVSRFLTVAYPEAGNPLSHVKPFVSPSSHNFSQCCREQKVADLCVPFCNIRNLVTRTPSPSAAITCINYMTPMVHCLADGRNHLPCCKRQNVPDVCLPSCIGNYNLTRVVDNILCLQYAAPILTCIAEGIETLPPKPREVTAEPISSTEIRVRWKAPSTSGKQLIKSYVINVTEEHSFDDIPASSGKVAGKSEKKNSNSTFPKFSFKAEGSSDSFTITGLKPFTVYEIVMMSVNSVGNSISTNSIRSLTQMSSQHMEPDKKSQTASSSKSKSIDSVGAKQQMKLPDLRKCCRDGGIKSDMCLDALCDSTKDYNSSAIMMCAHFVNITFKCISASNVDSTECCSQRGVSAFCQTLCRPNTAVSVRHSICFAYFPSYLNCHLEKYSVLPSAPMDLSVTTVHHTWALLAWRPPIKRASTVTRYTVNWKVRDEVSLGFDDNVINTESVAASPFLLDGLRPGTQYEVWINAVNKYGSSQDSIRVDFRTDPSESTVSVESGMNAARSRNIYNETACCLRANISSLCAPLCSYHVRVNEVMGLGPLCVDSLTASIIVRCTVGGRDHKPCCERRGVSPECLALCSGTIDGTPFQVGTRCGPEGPNILLCVKEGAETLPGMPWDLHAFKVTKNSIYVRWKVPETDHSPKPLNYSVRYTSIVDYVPAHPLRYKYQVNTTLTETVLDNLNASTIYSIHVISVNEYGTSLPSFVLMVKTMSDEQVNEDRLVATIGPPHSLEAIHQTYEMVSLRWLPPLYISPDATISYVVHFRMATETEWQKVQVNFNSADLAGLLPDTKYAVAVQAVTENGYNSPLSETIIVFTDPIVPVSVDPPVLLPPGPISEGDNVTILCIGRGLPPPVISILINGQVVFKTMAEKVYYIIPSMVRNISSIGCYAANGVQTHDTTDAHKSISVRVRSTPIVNIKEEFLRAMKFQEIRIPCMISGDPKPNVTWLKDGDDQMTILPGPDVQIRLFEDAMIVENFVSVLILKRVTQMDTGRYICKAINEMGSSSDSVEMQVVMEKVERGDIAACCLKSGVPPECLGACTSRGIDIDFSIEQPQCVNEIGRYLLCARDGYDHTQCCMEHKVHQNCMHFCEGVPSARYSETFCLLTDAKIIVHCLSGGHNRSNVASHHAIDHLNLMEDYDFFYQNSGPLPAPSTALITYMMITIFFGTLIVGLIGGALLAYKRLTRTRITSGEDVIGFENQSYLRDNDSVDLSNTGFSRAVRTVNQSANPITSNGRQTTSS
ncbi:Ig-like and fibronectin type-III domain-containing protein 2 isoform X2 [Brevipalpus obovatus]|uniref:Ig-like and fibronectin type-III domain-containing protein 2 isoform X2 n=1 Tax=Brevipalpus obovatus TaxID=246614 RepID=UPI003D9DE528